MPVHSPASRGCLLLPDSRPCRTYLAFAAKRTTFPAGKSITGHEPMSTEPERKTRTTYEMQLQDMHLILFNAATSKHLAVSAYLQRLTAPKICTQVPAPELLHPPPALFIPSSPLSTPQHPSSPCKLKTTSGYLPSQFYPSAVCGFIISMCTESTHRELLTKLQI